DRQHDRRPPDIPGQCEIRTHLLAVMPEAHRFDRRGGQPRGPAEGRNALFERGALAGGGLRRPSAAPEGAGRPERTSARSLGTGLLPLHGAGLIAFAHPAPRRGPFIAIGAADVRQDLAHVVRLHPGQRIGVAIGAVLNRLLELRPRALRRGLRQRHAAQRKEREQGNQEPQDILPLIWPWLSLRPSIGAGTARDRSRPPPSPILSNLAFRYARRTSR